MNKLNGEETNKLAYTKSLLLTFLCKNINDYYRFNKTKVSLKNVPGWRAKRFISKVINKSSSGSQRNSLKNH